MAFTIRTTKPVNNKFYIMDDTGGYSWCIIGKPSDATANVLSNCVGYACGRFNEIIGSMKYPALNCNAENFIERAQSWYPEIEIITDINEGQPGDIICWEGLGNLAGHVAVIEKRNGAGNYYTSESSYGGTAFFNATRTNANGRLGTSSNYSFNGFLRHPEFHVDPTPAVDPFPGVTDEELAARVWAGEFGSGVDRQNALGIRYDDVQSLVNQGVGKPKEESSSTETTLAIGDNVEIVGYGAADSYGNGARAGGIGWTRQILKIINGRPNPYRVGNSKGTTGWYPESSLKKK